MTSLDAVILAGGAGTRLGGRSKPLLEFDGRSLLDRVIEGARLAGCRQVIVVGPPELDRPGVLRTSEDPPFGGPVAGIAAALEHAGADEVLLLAADLRHGDQVAVQLARLDPTGDGAVLMDESGAAQWLAARLRTPALRRAIQALDDSRGSSMRRLLGSLNLTEVAVSADLVHDIDTPEDLDE